MKDHLCDWGDCENTDVAISINYRNEERPRFCCEEHAANWLIRRSALVIDRKPLNKATR
jgi:hypothetical protein